MGNTTRQFLDAFRRDDKARMLRLLSPLLLAHNADGSFKIAVPFTVTR